MNKLVTNGMILDVETGECYRGTILIEGTRIQRIFRSEDPLPSARYDDSSQ